MKPETVTTRSPEETIRFARRFAGRLKPGDVICLDGDLGSGKTTFIKGIALGLGLKRADDVRSPTFVVMHIYPARMPLYHFDLYRLEGAVDFEAVGLEDFAWDPKAVTCVEWAGRARDFFPPEAWRIVLRSGAGDRRTIVVEAGKG